MNCTAYCSARLCSKVPEVHVWGWEPGDYCFRDETVAFGPQHATALLSVVMCFAHFHFLIFFCFASPFEFLN